MACGRVVKKPLSCPGAEAAASPINACAYLHRRRGRRQRPRYEEGSAEDWQQQRSGRLPRPEELSQGPGGAIQDNKPRAWACRP